MKQVRNQALLRITALVLFITITLVGCNTWPTIIAVAQAMSAVTSIVYPGVGALSNLAVGLLQQAESAYQAYEAGKNSSTEAAYVAAIQSIETQLPADLAALKLPAADQAKVVAVINIILDFVEAEASQVPATSALVANARARRQAKPVQRMSRSEIKKRWQTEVCQGDAHCNALVK